MKPAREEVRSVELPADGNNRKAGWFELIAGKSIAWDGDAKRSRLSIHFVKNVTRVVPPLYIWIQGAQELDRYTDLVSDAA